MHKAKFLTAIFCCSALILVQSCRKEVFDTIIPPEITTPLDTTKQDDCNGIDYESGAKAIIESKCTSCHQAGGSGPGDYNKVDVLKANLQKIKQAAVTIDRMPPSGPLTEEEKETLRLWIDCGGAFPSDNNRSEELTYEKDIKSLVESKCTACHQSGGSGPGDFTKTEPVKTVVNNGKFKNRVITQKNMPPAGSPQFTSDELDKIERWLNDGAKFE